MREFAHNLTVRKYGREEPVPAWSTVDEGKLDSALHAPRHSFAGVDMYSTLEDKAAVLLYSIAKAHALPNGNKRMAMVSTFLFVALNGHWWAAEGEEVRAHVTWLASSDARSRSEALAYMSRYFATRLVSILDVVEGEAAVEIATLLPS